MMVTTVLMMTDILAQLNVGKTFKYYIPTIQTLLQNFNYTLAIYTI